METYLFCGLEDLILLEWQYSPNCPQIPLNLYQISNMFFADGQDDPKSHMENINDPNYLKDILKKNKVICFKTY